MKARLRLPSKKWAVLLVAMALLALGSDLAFALYSAHALAPNLALHTTPSDATSTTGFATASPSPLTSPTSLPLSHSQTTHDTPAPNPAGNNLAVYVDYGSGCYLADNEKRPYPNMFFTNTYPDDNAILNWSGTVTNGAPFFVDGDGGAGIEGGKTEMVEILPLGPAVGPLNINVQDWGFPWTGVKGWWQGTVYPC